MRSNSRELNILALSLDDRLFEAGSGARERTKSTPVTRRDVRMIT
jgi:hypothetical protein